MSRRALWGARFVLAAVASGTMLLGLAMHLYPGGTALDPQAAGHSFWLNFLCDLTAPVARNGVANPVGSEVARVGMLVLSLGLGATWLVVPAFFEEQRAVARVVRAAGAICVLALVAVPVLDGAAHSVAIYTSAGAGLTAGVFTVAALARGRSPWRALLLAAVLAATATDSVFYAEAVAARARPVAPELPFTQRLAGLLAVAWMVATAVEVLARGRAARAPDRARA
jgi:hypothetical protein